MSREIMTTIFGTTSTLQIEMPTKMKKGQSLFTNQSPKLTQALPKQIKWKESRPPIFVFTLREAAAVKGRAAGTTIESPLNQTY